MNNNLINNINGENKIQLNSNNQINHINKRLDNLQDQHNYLSNNVIYLNNHINKLINFGFNVLENIQIYVIPFNKHSDYLSQNNILNPQYNKNNNNSSLNDNKIENKINNNNFKYNFKNYQTYSLSYNNNNLDFQKNINLNRSI